MTTANRPVAEADLDECSECGHQHYDSRGRRYYRCPLTVDGCACPMNPAKA